MPLEITAKKVYFDEIRDRIHASVPTDLPSETLIIDDCGSHEKNLAIQHDPANEVIKLITYGRDEIAKTLQSSIPPEKGQKIRFVQPYLGSDSTHIDIRIEVI